jgi:inhibitor of KinA sporulation pathway (predicted exonuclease)
VRKKRLDHIVVVDIEATCWDSEPPPGQENEIIEVGVCLLRIANGERTERSSILVRPERSRVSPFCTQLTTLTQAQVDTGCSFAEACAQLKERFASDQRLWASYGDYDRQMFERQCRERNVAYPFGKGHLNVKSLLAIAAGMPRELGMERALDYLGVPLEGTHHRGDDDAWNIAAILAKVLMSARAGLPRRPGGTSA